MTITSSVCKALTINAPDWFRDAEFLRWLNSRKDPLMTWHAPGDTPSEYSDIVVFVCPTLSGEGSEDGQMPDAQWSQVVEACRSHFGPDSGHHIFVRITNLDADAVPTPGSSPIYPELVGDYRVNWCIDIDDADNPRDAARQAMEYMTRPGSEATVFEVTDNQGRTVTVDLLDDENEEN